jgi:hypothetical protein
MARLKYNTEARHFVLRNGPLSAASIQSCFYPPIDCKMLVSMIPRGIVSGIQDQVLSLQKSPRKYDTDTTMCVE